MCPLMNAITSYQHFIVYSKFNVIKIIICGFSFKIGFLQCISAGNNYLPCNYYLAWHKVISIGRSMKLKRMRVIRFTKLAC